MPVIAVLKCLLRWVVLPILVVFFVFTAVVRIQSYRFQHRAEHLMADIQELKLRQSNWGEAKALMTRWGRYGGYEGSCNASFCHYRIALESPVEAMSRYIGGRFAVSRYGRVFLFPLEIAGAVIDYAGGRAAELHAGFVVQDGVAVRKNATFIYDVRPSLSDPSGYALIAASRTGSRLTGDDFFLVDTEQLAEHPYYVVSRPGGCTFCVMAWVGFAPDIPPTDLRPLLTFDFSCVTRLIRACKNLEDIYPAADAWHLYDGALGARPRTPRALACRVPLFARGREAAQILSVTALTAHEERSPGEVTETAEVRLNEVIKGKSDYNPGDILKVVSRSYAPYTPLAIETPLTPGRRFLVLSFFREDKSPIELKRCLAMPDTADARHQLALGAAQNEALRVRDPREGFFIPY